MNIYTVYKDPTDYPGKFVIRRFIISRKHVEPANLICVEDDLETALAKLPPGLTKVDRLEDDDPKILEIWM